MLYRTMRFGFIFLVSVTLFSCKNSDTHLSPNSLEYRLNNLDAGVMVVAHRACWHQAPENSLKAIEDCIELGVDMVEIDVRRSADNILVLMHDKSVNRTTNGQGKVSQMNLSEIKALRLKERLGGELHEYTNEKIPTFKEALKVARGRILINVDAKQDVFLDAMKEVSSLGMEKQVVIKMEVPPDSPLLTMPFLKETNFMAKITESSEALSKRVIKYAAFNPIAFEVKAKTEKYLGEGADDIAEMGVRLWVNTLSQSPEKAAGHIDSLALKKPDAHWGRLIELGVNMIQTDEPEALLLYLKDKNLR